MNSTKSTRRETYGNPLLQEHVHDPYRERRKLGAGTYCSTCGAVFAKGRWSWTTSETSKTHPTSCPACRRISDRVPAGELVLQGPVDEDTLDQIVNRVRNIERDERDAHPLHRVMSIESNDTDTTITTTDVHLPHRLGHAITDAWGGELQTHYDVDGYFARVVWTPAPG